ncbi:MAG TPA: hypothetical protein VKG89_09305, partial [Solirubrobacterales bacterium]|nr:hypothetical protein [Solirubrobacterales bacterium]
LPSHWRCAGARGETSIEIERRLNDGSAYRIVKMPLRPSELERSLRELGWSIEVTPTAGRGPFFWGSGAPTRK